MWVVFAHMHNLTLFYIKLHTPLLRPFGEAVQCCLKLNSVLLFVDLLKSFGVVRQLKYGTCSTIR